MRSNGELLGTLCEKRHDAVVVMDNKYFITLVSVHITILHANSCNKVYLFTNLDISFILEGIQESGVHIAMFVLGVGENGALWHRRNEGSQLPEEREGGRMREREREGGRGREREGEGGRGREREGEGERGRERG